MVDIFRVPPVRLLGYGFAIGEALRYSFSYSSVNLAYNIGTGFVIAHVLHHTVVALEKGPTNALFALAETICWEGLASVILPTFCNYYICRFISDVLYEAEGVPSIAKRWGPFLTGVCMVPLYLARIDPLVVSFLQPIFAPYVTYSVVG